MSDAEKKEREEREYRQVEGARAELLAAMGCPTRHSYLVSSNDDDWKRTRAVELVEQSLEEDHSITVLSGGVGLGKTAAGVYYLRRRTKRWMLRYVYRNFIRGRDLYADVEEEEIWPPLFLTAARLARWPRFKESEMAKLEQPDVLVIDDVGVEFDDASGNFRSLFDALLNERYAEERPTLITTNLPAAAFAARYGARVVDRIREMGAFYEISGPSLRAAPPAPQAPPPTPPTMRVLPGRKGAA